MRRFLSKVQEGELRAFVTDFALHSVGIILTREGKATDLPDVFTRLSAFEGLTILHASIEEHADIAWLARERRLDFDDAYQAYFALQRGVPVVSFDRDFDGKVARQEPADYLR